MNKKIIKDINEELKNIKKEGYGKVELIIKKGKIDFIKSIKSKKIK